MALEDCKRIEFYIDGRKSVIICPEKPLDGNPWVWKTEFFAAFNFAERALLDKGFHLAYHCVSNMYGAPKSIKMMKEFYDVATSQYGLSKQPALFGFSRGGLYACNFALKHPDCVKMLYLDAPVLDVASWPGAKYEGIGDLYCWEECKAIYGITEDKWQDFHGSPLDNAETLAATNIPILLVCGAVDHHVPYHENGKPFFERVKAAGGKIARVVKPYCDHHPHGLYDTSTVCNFVLSAYGLNDESGFHPQEISYNSARTVVYGDSITKGTYTAIGQDAPNSVADKTWADHVCESLGLKLIHNYGTNGISISSKTNVLPELALANHNFENDDIALVLIAMGTNDFGTNVPLGTPSDCEDTSFYGALDVVCRKLKEVYENLGAVYSAEKSGIVFITPIRRYDEVANKLGKRLNDYRVAIKEVAHYRYGFRVINGENIGFDPKDADFRAKHMVDGVHPDPEIQKKYGEYVANELLKADNIL